MIGGLMELRKENGLPTLYEKPTIRQRIASVKKFLFRK